MKVRIGISLGPAGTPGQFADAVDSLEQAGVDSLWLPETVYSPVVEPFTGMAFALARTRRLKAGSGISVLPGRRVDRKSTRLNSSHQIISYAVFCLKKKKNDEPNSSGSEGHE